MGIYKEKDIERKAALGGGEPWWDGRQWVGCDKYFQGCSCVICCEADVRNYKPLEERAILDSPAFAPLEGTKFPSGDDIDH